MSPLLSVLSVLLSAQAFSSLLPPSGQLCEEGEGAAGSQHGGPGLLQQPPGCPTEQSPLRLDALPGGLRHGELGQGGVPAEEGSGEWG